MKKSTLLANLKAQSDLVAFQLASLINDSVTDFDLYIGIGGHMVLYAPKPYFWSKDELARLHTEGHRCLYYDPAFQEKVEVYRKVYLWPEIDTTLPPDKRINQIMDLAAQFSRLLFEHEFSESAFDRGKSIAINLLHCIQEKPSCVQALEQLKYHHDYTYYHSARVAAYATAIALQMSLNNEKDLFEITLGCLLHDLGKSGVPLAVLNKPGKLTAQEWELVRKHPELGVKMVSQAALSLVPIEIILHHHEREDGGGYPHNISGTELLTEVKIAGFADIFDALTSLRSYQKTRTRFEAMDFIKNNLLDHIYKDAYKAMIRLLG